MPYVDYTFYASPQFGGSLISEAEFPALAIKAESHVDLITYDRLWHGAPITDNVRRAVCAVAEVIKAQQNAPAAISALQSESVDGYSVAYRSAAEAAAALNTARTDAARPYLLRTGLMDRSAR